MSIKVDVWLRGSDSATSESLRGFEREPQQWVDEDVRKLLHGMLETMHRLKHPSEAPSQVSLRGLSWIVNPFEEGGVVVAIEIGMGAVVAGPFDIDRDALEAMIGRVIVQPPLVASSTTVH
jgi:hypothetical protein